MVEPISLIQLYFSAAMWGKEKMREQAILSEEINGENAYIISVYNSTVMNLALSSPPIVRKTGKCSPQLDGPGFPLAPVWSRFPWPSEYLLFELSFPRCSFHVAKFNLVLLFPVPHF